MMTTAATEPGLRRIAVALDGASDAAATIEAALRLAARHHASLAAVFVVDPDILNGVALSFVRTVSATTPAAAPVSRKSTEREMRSMAARARRAVEEQADRKGVSWSFRVVRRRFAQAMPDVARKADLMVVGGPGRGRPRHAGSASPARTASAPCPVPLLFPHPEGSAVAPLVVLWDGGSLAAVALAARLALAEGGAPGILLPPGLPADREAELRRWCLERKLPADIRRAAGAGPRGMAESLRRMGAGTAVLAGDSPLLRTGDCLRTLERAGCAVLLVR